MASGFSYSEVMGMDMLSFGALLGKVMRRKQEEDMNNILGMRLAFCAENKAWKQWLRASERALGTRQEGPDSFKSAVDSGHLSLRNKR